MLTRKSVRRNITQTSALVERNIFFEFRFKTVLFTNYFSPFVQILMPLIVFGAFFNLDQTYKFGYWDASNYLLFMIIAFCVQFIRQMIDNFKQLFLREKFWKTLQALMVAPINRYVLLFGIIISESILISIPFVAFFIVGLIFFPIPPINLLFVILTFMCIIIFFGSIGLIVSFLIVTNESYYRIFSLGLNFLFWLSCFSYPLQIFPEIVQFFIRLNPIYYFIDIIRLNWLIGLDPVLGLSYLTPIHVLIVILFTIFLPIISAYLFNIFFKKYGISGY